MNFAPLEAIADAVLYEGYILYPYRASSLKNRKRWNFGTLFPRAVAEAQSPQEKSSFQAEVLFAGDAASLLHARIRFLQWMPGADGDPQDWSEGLLQSRPMDAESVGALTAGLDLALDFTAPPEEAGRSSAASIATRLTLRAHPLRTGLWRLRFCFSNETPVAGSEPLAGAQKWACVSAHLLLGVDQGRLISLLDPPEEFAADAAGCTNRGVFPVLAGDAADATRMLCSPIILYDYPQIAPESAGDYFDGTEMDEMLALRVLTLTDEEKAEMRRGDRRAAEILARTETLPGDHLMKLHGAVRGLHPSTQPAAESATGEPTGESWNQPWNPFAESPPVESVSVFGVDVRCGDRVRLWPGKQADILDMAMQGKAAIIEAIEQDLEGGIQFAVVLEDDPGRDLGLLRQAGHRFFFTPEEIEPLGLEAR